MARAELPPAQLIEWGVAVKPYPGESLSGDQSIVKNESDRAFVAVVDALGHGKDAAPVAGVAISVLDTYSDEPLDELFQSCHKALLSLRGAVISAAVFDGTSDRLIWLAVGNVEGLLLREVHGKPLMRETLPMWGGVVGYRMPVLQTSQFRLNAGDLLIFATDGIRTEFITGVLPGESPQTLADQILRDCYKQRDDALVLVVRYRGCN